MTVERKVLQFGRQSIPYSLSFSPRKSLKITVFPDRRVDVDAPKQRSLEDVERAVGKRSRWIVRQRMRFEKYHPLPSPRLYVSGETHRYLGKQYRLRVRAGASPSVKLSGGFLMVHTPRAHHTCAVRSLVQSWYQEHAKEVYLRRLKECCERVKHHGIPYPALRMRKMRTRWGSCTRNCTIVLNPDLVRLPTPCIDYVITHELCHLKLHNHSHAFYQLLSNCMPDWITRRERLNLAAVQN